VIEGTRAVGVVYNHKGENHSVIAEGEVILCGGAVNSPQLLMLSGIGDPAELLPHNIPLKAALSGVGKNLQDHVAALLIYSRRDESPLLRTMRADRLLLSLGQGILFGTGIATELPGGITAFVKSSPDQPIPDIQLLFIAGSLTAKPYLPPFTKPFADSFACRIVLLRPESRGSIGLASGQPTAHPKIRQKLLASSKDWSKLSAGIRIFRQLTQLPVLAPYIDREIGPGVAVKTENELEYYVRKTAVTAHHPCGTCRMGVGGDDGAVVDSELRVHGIRGLRVVDASVFPDLIGGNINAAVIMIAEKASDLILSARRKVL
jgi:choline dehydrogenase-like flavoprotein